MNDKFFEGLKEKIKPYFEDYGGHSFEHTKRVYNLALKIAENEIKNNNSEIDLDIIKASALLHDIARKKEDTGEIKCHAKEGAKIAREILSKTEFPKEKIPNVCNAIATHRYSKKLKANTREAEILQDADRLDALGAIIIARVFHRCGKIKTPMYNPDIPKSEIYVNSNESKTAINHFYEKILKIKPETFKTKKAQEIAKKRYEFVKEFVERFEKEWRLEQ